MDEQHGRPQGPGNSGFNSEMDDPELAAAIAASYRDSQPAAGAGPNEDPELAAAIAASYREAQPAAAAGGQGEDPDLAAAIAASYRTHAGGDMGGDMEQSEDQMLAQAMHLSRLEEEERRRREGEDVEMGDAGRGSSSATSSSAYAAGSSSSGAAGSASSSAAAPSLPAAGSRGKWPGPGLRGIDEDQGSDAAVAGGSSRGSSREPGGSPKFTGMQRMDDEVDDPHLAAAIEASYAAQTEHGMVSHEDDMLQQALRMSQMEEDSRQRAALKEQQEVELQESIMMDQIREQEEKRRRLEEQERQAMEASRQQEEERQRQEEERRRQEEQEQKRARVPPEPPAGEPGRVDIQIRTPDGKRVRRAFRGTDTVGQVYDYIDVEGILGEAMVGQAYRLVSTMPRREYEDRSQTLQDAGLSGQCALLVERSEA